MPWPRLSTPPYPQVSTTPTATNAKARYLLTRFSRKGSSVAGSTTASSSSTAAMPARSPLRSKQSSLRMPSTPRPYRDQPVGPQAQHRNRQQQNRGLGNRAAHQVLQPGLRLRDGKARKGRADQTLHAAEHHHDERVDDVELAGAGVGRADHREHRARDARQAAAEREGNSIYAAGVDAH